MPGKMIDQQSPYSKQGFSPVLNLRLRYGADNLQIVTFVAYN